MSRISLCLFLTILSHQLNAQELKTPDDYEKAAKRHFRQGDFRRVIVLSQKGLRMRPGSLPLLNYLGQSYFYIRQYHDSMTQFQRLLHQAAQINDPKIYGLAYNNIGEIHRAKGQYQKALSFYRKALTHHETAKQYQGVASAYHNVARCYRAMGRHNKAITYLNISINLKTNIRDQLGLALSYIEMAHILEFKGQLDSSLDYLKQSKNLLKRYKSAYHLAKCYGNLGRIYYLKKLEDEALAYFQKALTLGGQVGDHRGSAIRSTHIAIIYMKRQRYKRAYSFSKRAVDIRRGLGEDLSPTEQSFHNNLKRLAHLQEG
ncbi:MAG: tetratricopeptide repeat protein [Spirochaetota bacterium]|nr:tetratricopeptide repeat protein [Spirochaetota bacterium]